jgi:hypothetical protein
VKFDLNVLNFFRTFRCCCPVFPFYLMCSASNSYFCFFFFTIGFTALKKSRYDFYADTMEILKLSLFSCVLLCVCFALNEFEFGGVDKYESNSI